MEEVPRFFIRGADVAGVPKVPLKSPPIAFVAETALGHNPGLLYTIAFRVLNDKVPETPAPANEDVQKLKTSGN